MTAYTFSPQPAISTSSVTAALNSLIYTLVQYDDADLYGLTLVDEFLEDATFPLTLYDRRYALCCILAQLITERLTFLGHLFELELPPEDELYREALVSVRAYAQAQNPELTGFCWLYYRYVRAELNISMTVFSNACFITTRTLRRYQSYAIQRLTDILIKQEWKTRRLRGSSPDGG